MSTVHLNDDSPLSEAHGDFHTPRNYDFSGFLKSHAFSKLEHVHKRKLDIINQFPLLQHMKSLKFTFDGGVTWETWDYSLQDQLGKYYEKGRGTIRLYIYGTNTEVASETIVESLIEHMFEVRIVNFDTDVILLRLKDLSQEQPITEVWVDNTDLMESLYNQLFIDSTLIHAPTGTVLLRGDLARKYLHLNGACIHISLAS